MTKNKQIVITGLGPIASPGIGKKSLWEGIKELNLGIGKVSTPRINGHQREYFLNRVKDFDLHNFDFNQNDISAIEGWKGKKISKDLGMMLAAVNLALHDAKIRNRGNNHALSMVVTHENPGLEDLLWGAWKNFEKIVPGGSSKGSKDFFYKFYRHNSKLAYETQSFMLLFHLTRMFKINKYSLYLNNACASGLYALETASDMIKSGKAEQVVVVAADCPDIFKCLWFDELGMYPKDGKIKPFSWM